MKSYPEFMKESATLQGIASGCLVKILLSEDRMSKHKPWTWDEEPEDGHLNKAIRHVLTYQLIRDKQQPKDEEDHLALALTRLTMAIAKRGT